MSSTNSGRPRFTYRGRFAPSPTGDLHFGSLVAAVGSWLRARIEGGVWLIRIEDLDPPREVPGSATRIIETLARFGMSSDEPIEYQSQRADLYARALETLRDQGALFPCTCTRTELAASGGLHREACVPAPDRAQALRVRAPRGVITFEDAVQGPQRQDLYGEVGDFVVRRADGLTAYQLAVVVDDAAQGITEIVRGADLLDSTPRQLYLQQLLSLPHPRYAHLPLAVDAQGVKLSKQAASRPVDPDDPLPALVAALKFLGLDTNAHEGLRSPEAALALAALQFDLARVPRAHSLSIDEHAPAAP